MSETTKKIVESVKNDIKNSSAEKSKELINTIETTKTINNFEEE
jgi:hypothetical protein